MTSKFDPSTLNDHQKALLDRMDEKARARFDGKPDAEKIAVMAMHTGTAPEDDRPLLRRSPNREQSCSGVVACLRNLQWVADLQTQLAPKRLDPTKIVPYVRNWLSNAVLTGYIRNASGQIREIPADAWSDESFAECIAGRKITIIAEPRKDLIELDGSAEAVDHYDKFRKLTQPDSSTVLTGLPVRSQTVTGHVFFYDWDIERAFGYGWIMYEPPPSLDDCEETGEVPEPHAAGPTTAISELIPVAASAVQTIVSAGGRPLEHVPYIFELCSSLYERRRNDKIIDGISLGKETRDRLHNSKRDHIVPKTERTYRKYEDLIYSLWDKREQEESQKG